MRRINAPFNNCRLIRFDTAVRICLNPTGSWVAFNPLDSSHDQSAHPGRDAGCYKPAASAPPVLAPASERGAEPSAQDSIPLEPGKPVERELFGGQSHFFKITMISGQYLRVIVAQRGIDVAVALLTPDGKKIGEVDMEQLIEKSETISAIAKNELLVTALARPSRSATLARVISYWESRRRRWRNSTSR
jgi:hypothetical protein